MRDLAKIGLPLQIAGFAVMLFGFTHLLAMQIGFPVHLAGDMLFFLEMRRRGRL